MGSLILLVDNDLEFTYLIERYSRTIHWSILRAEDAREALQIVRNHKPSMILLNLLLPPNGGYEVLRALKENEDARKIPITVFSSIPDEEQAWAEGADFCLWKPVMLEDFISALEAANLFIPGRIGEVDET